MKNFELCKIIKLISDFNNVSENSYIFTFHQNEILCNLTKSEVKLTEFISSKEELIKIELPKKIRWRAFSFGQYEKKKCVILNLIENPKTLNSEYTLKSVKSFYRDTRKDYFILAGLANQISRWDIDNIYCGKCGKEFTFSSEEVSKVCLNCGNIKFPQIAPAVIILIKKNNKILLAHNTQFPNKMFSLIAGFVNVGETLEEAIKREVLEEVSIQIKNLKYISSQPWPFPQSLMLGFTAEWESGEIKCDGVEISKARWFSSDELQEVILPSKVSIARKIIDLHLKK